MPPAIAGEPADSRAIQECEDDSEVIQPDDRVVLIVENDTSFAKFILEMAHECGFKGIITTRGADALATIRQRRVDAITLDINLHDLDGWRVLARLKDDSSSRHIPVYIITTEEESLDWLDAYELAAA